jgi:hypothetical protein
VHAVVGGFTTGNTFFLLMNPDFTFYLLFSDGRYLVYRRRGERFTDQCVYESDRFGGGRVMVLSGICHDGRTQLKIVQVTLNAVKTIL